MKILCYYFEMNHLNIHLHNKINLQFCVCQMYKKILKCFLKKLYYLFINTYNCITLYAVYNYGVYSNALNISHFTYLYFIDKKLNCTSGKVRVDCKMWIKRFLTKRFTTYFLKENGLYANILYTFTQ